MLKRATWFGVGFGAGLASSVYLKRKVQRVARSYTPPELAQRTGRQLDAVRREVAAALADGRDAMRSREAELRATFTDHPSASAHAAPSRPPDGATSTAAPGPTAPPSAPAEPVVTTVTPIKRAARRR